MVFISKGPKPRGGTYLICDNGRRGVRCKSHSISYEEVEETVLNNCLGLRPEQVLPNPDEQKAELVSLRRRLDGIQGELVDIERRSENYLDAIGHAPSAEVRSKLSRRLEDLESKKKTLGTDRESVEKRIVDLERGRQSVAQWQRDLTSLRGALAKGVDSRLRMRVHLRELIAKIEVFAVGFAKKAGRDQSSPRPPAFTRRRGESAGRFVRPGDDADFERLAHYIEELTAELNPAELGKKEFGEFCEWVTTRRMSKHGRFLRIHFKTPGHLRRDLVPGNSIADGRGLEIEDGKPGWRIIQPDLNKLKRQFISFKRHQVRP
jgi:hypothetical protein